VHAARIPGAMGGVEDGAAPRRHYAYLLRCADGSYYAGYTVDPRRRLRAHRDGRASRYTRSRAAVALVAVWRCPDRRAALALERLLKRLPHAAKHRLATGRPDARLAGGARALGARRLGTRRLKRGSLV
jgi:putative endonuclease